MATILFLHGLNTFGDDLIHVGPLTFGPMDRHLKNAFSKQSSKRKIEFISIPGIGAGSPEEQASKALSFIEANVTLKQGGKFHLFGQSTGGLVARVLSHHPSISKRVASLITMGSPHTGADIAFFGLEFQAKFPRLQKTFSAMGYDTKAKTDFFKHFTPDSLIDFNRRFPSVQQEFREICLLCEIEPTDVSFPLKLLGRLNRGVTLKRGDGFITTASQCRGEVLGPFALDHFAQLGAFLHFGPEARKKSRFEFQRLIDVVVNIVNEH